jgi:hypothetical protein
VKSEGLLSRTLETVHDTVIRMNDWITTHGVRVYNIETVVLPVPCDDEYDSGTNDFGLDGRNMQVIRLWYAPPE